MNRGFDGNRGNEGMSTKMQTSARFTRNFVCRRAQNTSGVRNKG